MNTLGTIRKFKTANFTVIVDAIEEISPDLSWDEDGSQQEGIESGKYILFCARARVFYNGLELASDYLGNCIYESLTRFQDHKECAAYTRKLRAEGSNAICGSYFSDMVKTVCTDARTEFNKLQSVKLRAT